MQRPTMRSNHASVLLLEFNELTPTLIHRFMGEGKLPNFRRFYEEARAYVTDAEETQDKLEPWIQWVTVHTGLSFAEHGVFTLGEGHKLKAKCIWDLLSDAGHRVWVCGSMNPRYDRPLNGYLLPDPWTMETAPYPDELLPYYRFVQRNVQEHTSDRVPLSRAAYVSFLSFMIRHGLSATTVRAIAQQLIRERTGRARWQRAVILDKLQWDVFRFYYGKLRPAFATYFLNSTAHLQHMYWRNMEPEPFRVKPTAAEQAELGGAVFFGYQEMDKLLGRFLSFAGDHTTLVLCTALSQQPCLIYEDQGGKTFYRPRNFEQLLAFGGVTARHTVAPVMSEEFRVCFDIDEGAREAEGQLQGIRLDGAPALHVRRSGADLLTGCSIFRQVPQDALLTSGERSGKFFDLFYQAEGLKSGMHHRDGFLWIRLPQREHRVTEGRVPLRSVAPTILSMFGLTPPAFMQAKPLL